MNEPERQSRGLVGVFASLQFDAATNFGEHEGRSFRFHSAASGRPIERRWDELASPYGSRR